MRVLLALFSLVSLTLAFTPIAVSAEESSSAALLTQADLSSMSREELVETAYHLQQQLILAQAKVPGTSPERIAAATAAPITVPNQAARARTQILIAAASIAAGVLISRNATQTAPISLVPTQYVQTSSGRRIFAAMPATANMTFGVPSKTLCGAMTVLSTMWAAGSPLLFSKDGPVAGFLGNNSGFTNASIGEVPQLVRAVANCGQTPASTSTTVISANTSSSASGSLRRPLQGSTTVQTSITQQAPQQTTCNTLQQFGTYFSGATAPLITTAGWGEKVALAFLGGGIQGGAIAFNCDNLSPVQTTSTTSQ